MGSVSTSPNLGVTDLLQTLSNLNSPVVSSKTAVSALESAPPADLVQLSSAAIELSNVDAMFGISTSSSSGTSNLLTSLEDQGATTSTSASSLLTSASPSAQNANYQSAIQAEVTNGLFGTSTTNALSGSLFNVIG
jgi:hypothetical protein